MLSSDGLCPSAQKPKATKTKSRNTRAVKLVKEEGGDEEIMTLVGDGNVKPKVEIAYEEEVKETVQGELVDTVTSIVKSEE
jgi:hypothetical protein